MNMTNLETANDNGTDLDSLLLAELIEAGEVVIINGRYVAAENIDSNELN